ncbi:hypothetical protein GE21DRAFT_1292474 [Neurospora crassa]|nr:hypothetical protein GE21DRAFT_1292474 [Neurospora crassa]
MVTASFVAFFLFSPDSVKLPICSPTLSVQTNNDGPLTSFAPTHTYIDFHLSRPAPEWQLYT